MVCVVIMAGGRGERFWPKSRADKPKQFTDLTGTGNMLYLTYQRVSGMVGPDRIFVVTGREYREITTRSIPELPAENIIIEPEGRNTAPCIGLAAVTIEKRFPGATMVVLPADHLIKEEAEFLGSLKTAVELAESTSGFVTLGIQPTRPETGYGYLKTGGEIPLREGRKAYRVAKFVEKPDEGKARRFLAEGSYLWNAGIFIWKVPVIIEAFKTHLPEIYEGLRELQTCLDTDRFEEVLDRIYPGFTRVSIDYGIMEKVGEVYTVPGRFYWDDVGTWRSLERVLGTDSCGNVLRGQVVALETTNTIIDAGNRLVAVIGAEDLIVVETDDITFVCHKDHTDRVRELLNELRSQKLERYL